MNEFRNRFQNDIRISEKTNNIIHKNINNSYLMTMTTVVKRAGFEAGESVAFLFNEGERLIIVVPSENAKSYANIRNVKTLDEYSGED